LNTIDDLEDYSNNILDIVSANVKKYREEKGFTQIQLALEIRKDNYHFNIKHIVKIAKVLDIDICKLFNPLK